jgi:hypothetical protein
MKPGERVLTIQSIVGALWSQDRSTTNLIFRQFGLSEPVGLSEPDARGFNDSGEDYDRLIRLVEAIPDDTLLAMADTLAPDRPRGDVGEAPAVPPSSEHGPWATDFFRIFVSHTYEYHKRVGLFKRLLEDKGVECFVAHADIAPSSEWRDAIRAALRTCEALVVYLTPDFRDSQWTDQEVGHCLATGVPILTVRFGAELHGFLERYQALNGETVKESELPDRVFGAFAAQIATRDRVADSLVLAFRRSPSFGTTSSLIDLARHVPRFTAEQLDGLEHAARENHEVRDYARVDRLHRLIEQHRERLL